MTSVWLTLTESNIREGGRPRDPLEICFNLTRRQAELFPEHPVAVMTDDGYGMVVLASGHAGKKATEHHSKNLRSNPATEVGEWLHRRKGLAKEQLVGRTVQFMDGGKGIFHARLMPEGWAR